MPVKKDKTLQDARQHWVLSEIGKMKLASPVTELSVKLGYGKSMISEVLNGKASISFPFFNKFCEVFSYNPDAVNHSLIDKLKTNLANEEKEPTETPVNTDEIDFDFNQNIPSMISKLLTIHERNSISMANMSEANVIMARAIEQLIGKHEKIEVERKKHVA